MEAFAGLALGIAASLHCGAMCGPLVIALHGGVRSGAGRGTARAHAAGSWAPVILHHLGRVLTYGALGFAAGAFGRAVMIGGFGRALSVLAGALLLTMAVGPVLPVAKGLTRRVGRLVSGALAAVRGSGPAGWHSLVTGALNALLPCGLVYAALAAAAATGHSGSAALFMMLFGIGTSPLLLGLSRSARYACAIGPQRLRLARPIALTLLGMLLVWRGVAGPAVHASSGNGGHDGHGVMPPATLAVR